MTRLRLLILAYLSILLTTPTLRADSPPPVAGFSSGNIQVSLDGKVHAHGGSDGVVTVNRRTDKTQLRLEGHKGAVHAVAFTPDGRFLASGGADHHVRLWNVAAGKELLVLRGHTAAVRELAFAPDGRLLASAGDDRTIRLWEMASGQEVLQIKEQVGAGLQIAFRPDSRALLVADPEETSIHPYDLATGKPLGRWTLERLEATLAEPVLAREKRTALRVTAHWAGGATQDVTGAVQPESKDDEVARVAEPDQIAARGPGRTAIVARYLGRSAAATVTVPYAAAEGGLKFEAANFIDELLATEWKKVNLRPTESAADGVFLRRAYLHLLGVPPTAEESRRFLESKAPDRRARLIDELLERPEFAEHWAREWGGLLRVQDKALGEKERASFQAWLLRAMQENWPADRLARELLLAEGAAGTNGAAAFYLLDQTPLDLAETTAHVFLGTNLRCARCHRSPTGDWSREAHLGLAAFFTRIERLKGPSPLIRLAPGGTLAHPVTGKEVSPRLPGPPEVAAGAEDDPRRTLARWLTHADNPSFARSLVNRYWAHLFGRGLVEPWDELGPSNPPCQPVLLDALARDFVKQKYDFKHLLRTLCNARVYQLGSTPPLAEDRAFFSRRTPQRLRGETLARAIARAAGVPPDVVVPLKDVAPAGEPGPFRRLGTGEGGKGGCERPSSESSLAAALHLINSDVVNKAITHKDGRVARLLAAGKKDEEILDELFLAVLSRRATPAEGKQALEHVRRANGPDARRTALQGILWALLNSKEFLFIP